MAVTPLYRRVDELIRELIGSGKLAPGDLIPSESQLATELDVSIGTVRKAIDSLVQERLLYRHQGKGTYVSRIDFNNSLFRFFSYGGAAGTDIRIHKETPVREIIQGDKAICDKLNVKTGSELIYIKRIGYAGEQVILVEKCWWVADAVPGLKDESIHIPDLMYAVIEDSMGVPVIRAEETLTAGVCDKKTADVLGLAERDPIVVLMRSTYTLNDKKIEYRITHGRADKFSYKTEIR